MMPAPTTTMSLGGVTERNLTPPPTRVQAGRERRLPVFVADAAAVVDRSARHQNAASSRSDEDVGRTTYAKIVRFRSPAYAQTAGRQPLRDRHPLLPRRHRARAADGR